MSNCVNCSTGLQNTGLIGNGKSGADVANKIFYMPLVANDGTINGIDVSSLDADTFTTLINEVDTSKRLFPLPIHEDITDERAEAIFETYTSGNKRKVREGNLPISFMILETAASYKAALDSFACKDVGFYYLDKCGNLIGGVKVGNIQRPIPIMSGSIDNRVVRAGYETVRKIAVSFEVDLRFNDADMTYIPCEVLEGFNIDLFNAKGLINLVGKTLVASNADKTITATITTDYGAVTGNLPVEGLSTLIELVLSPNTAQTPDSITETAAGVYAIEKDPAFANGTYFVRVKSTTKGFDDTALKSTTVEIS